VDQFRGVGANDGAAQDLAGGFVGKQFHKAVGLIDDKRFSVVAKRIGGGQVADGSISRLVL
jgi:hypothetical protein